MAQTTKSHIAKLLDSLRRRDDYLALLSCMALVVTAGVILAVMQHAEAINRTERILECHYNGNGAHTHSADCYDKSGTLVCPLEERELHVHDDSCYVEERHLICGYEEGQELEDGSVHQHTDECYEVELVLACGKEEITEEHVHGAGCFKTVKLNEEEAAEVENVFTLEDEEAAEDQDAPVEEDEGEASSDMPAQFFEEEIKDADGKVLVRVTVDAPEGAFPAGTAMSIGFVDSEEEKNVIEQTAQQRTGAEVEEVQLVDITFRDVSGAEIEPARSVVVKIASDVIGKGQESMIVHVDQDGNGALVDTLSESELRRRKQTTNDDELVFDVSAAPSTSAGNG